MHDHAHHRTAFTTCRLYGSLAIGWRNHLLVVLFWLIALGMKTVFDYFVLWKVRGSSHGACGAHLQSRQRWECRGMDETTC